MHGLLLAVGGIERPAVAPADVQRALGAVEIRAHVVFLRVVGGELAMLPGHREPFEIIHRHLMIRRVGGLLLVVQNRRARDVPAAGRIHAARIFLVRPQHHLIEPVNAPVAELAVAVIEELPPAAGMQLGVEGPQRRGAAPQVPVHVVRRLAVGLGQFAATAVMHEAPHHPDLAHMSVAQKFHRRNMMRPDAPVQADLHGAPGGARGGDHRAALVHRVTGGFFHEHMRAGFHGINALERVPMVGRRDDHHVGLFLRQQLAVIAIRLGLVAGQIGHLLGGDLERVAIDIRERDDFRAPAGHRFLENIFAPPTRADERGAQFFSRLGGAHQRRGAEGEAGGGGGMQKLAAAGFHGSSMGGSISCSVLRDRA